MAIERGPTFANSEGLGGAAAEGGDLPQEAKKEVRESVKRLEEERSKKEESEPERVEAQGVPSDEKLAQRFAEAGDVDRLLDFAAEFGGLQGSRQFFTPEKLRQRIEIARGKLRDFDALKGKLSLETLAKLEEVVFTNLPRRGGFRKRATELLRQELDMLKLAKRRGELRE